MQPSDRNRTEGYFRCRLSRGHIHTPPSFVWWAGCYGAPFVACTLLLTEANFVQQKSLLSDKSNFVYDKIIFVRQKLILSDKSWFCQTKVDFVWQKLILSDKSNFVLTKIASVNKSNFVVDKITFVETKFLLCYTWRDHSPSVSFRILS